MPETAITIPVDAETARAYHTASADTIEELDEVLRRPKFNRYIREEERLLFLSAFIRDAKVVDVTERV